MMNATTARRKRRRRRRRKRRRRRRMLRVEMSARDTRFYMKVFVAHRSFLGNLAKKRMKKKKEKNCRCRF